MTAEGRSIASVELLGVRVDLAGRDEALRAAIALFDSGAAHQIVTANALLILEAERSPELRRACRDAALVLSDSSGISFAAAVRGLPKPNRLPGIDFAFDLCAAAAERGYPVYFFGGRDGVARRAAESIHRRFPALRIAGVRSGFFDDADSAGIAGEIRASGARLALVALGMPKQDIWIHRHLPSLTGVVCVGVGGTFDVWSGAVPRAPKALRKIGFEWIYRLVRQPSRWRRMSRLPLFALRAILSREK